MGSEGWCWSHVKCVVKDSRLILLFFFAWIHTLMIWSAYISLLVYLCVLEYTLKKSLHWKCDKGFFLEEIKENVNIETVYITSFTFRRALQGLRVCLGVTWAVLACDVLVWCRAPPCGGSTQLQHEDADAVFKIQNQTLERNMTPVYVALSVLQKYT